MRSKLLVAGCASLAVLVWASLSLTEARGNLGELLHSDVATRVSTSSGSNDLVMLAQPSMKGAQAAQILHKRQDGMKALGDATKVIHRAIAGTLDLATLRSKSAEVVELSLQASSWFPLGTGSEAGKSQAKPDIWQNSADFAAKLRSFQLAARSFNAAVSLNDPAAINAKFADLGGTCKSCHDKYRSEEHH